MFKNSDFSSLSSQLFFFGLICKLTPDKIDANFFLSRPWHHNWTSQSPSCTPTGFLIVLKWWPWTRSACPGSLLRGEKGWPLSGCRHHHHPVGRTGQFWTGSTWCPHSGSHTCWKRMTFKARSSIHLVFCQIKHMFSQTLAVFKNNILIVIKKCSHILTGCNWPSIWWLIRSALLKIDIRNSLVYLSGIIDQRACNYMDFEFSTQWLYDKKNSLGQFCNIQEIKIYWNCSYEIIP